MKSRDVNNAFAAATTVFAIQVTLICFIVTNVHVPIFPNNAQTMGARLVCSILMHLCVESDIRQGLRMMKYAVNHHESFDYPKCAFFVGFMQYAGGLGAELCCMLFLA